MKIVLTSDLHYGFAGNTPKKIIRCFKKIQEENPDLVIIAGDIGTANQRQIWRCLETAREHISCDIAICYGNHDFWDRSDRKDKDSGIRSLSEIYALRLSTCSRLGIHILSSDPMIYGDVHIFGYDGWYATSNPMTKDGDNMPKYYEGCPIMPYLSNKAWSDFEKCLYSSKNYKGKKVLVTHHNIYEEPKFPKSIRGGNTRFYPEVKENFDVLCCGHTHVYQNYKDDNLLVLNCGSDYNDPKYIIFEV